MAFHRCVDCLLQHADTVLQGKTKSFEHVYDAKLAITIIGGDAVCAEHLRKRLEAKNAQNSKT